MRVFAGVYWGARREGIDTCADRARAWFSALAATSDRLAVWYHGGRRRPEMVIDAKSAARLEDLLRQGMNYKDVPREVIPELGFGLALWNGRDRGWDAGLSVKCGLYDPDPRLSNAVTFSIKFEGGEEAPTPSQLQALFRRMIEIWEPASGRLEQTYIRPYEGDRIPEAEDILYASYGTSGLGKAAGPGETEQVAQGRLWTSSQTAWKGPSF